MYFHVNLNFSKFNKKWICWWVNSICIFHNARCDNKSYQPGCLNVNTAKATFCSCSISLFTNCRREHDARYVQYQHFVPVFMNYFFAEIIHTDYVKVYVHNTHYRWTFLLNDPTFTKNVIKSSYPTNLNMFWVCGLFHLFCRQKWRVATNFRWKQ